ncbi:MAG TPA: alpha-amylase family glycosyl hydrolase [Anaerolineae bacterium]|nr:alpha-amylase family glycosyl hydrolase [Anaerolineae bacterium]HQM13389.1 alpha-amylase family glycosyl hydrolase [Anaerolineae bacterium]
MASGTNLKWWQRGAIYQIYPRSFKDTNGDGVGDLQGIIEKLPYLERLGVDAIWLSPFYPSPMADFGYDVADYCNVDPLFGDLEIFDRLVAETHARGMKLIIDWVPNHTSDQHPWFIESRSSRDNPKRDWYIWRDPRPDGSLPNNWGSFFGGPAWTFDPQTGQYYLHQFVQEQPELNWRNPEVKAAMLETLRFWMRRGVDGFRMDVIGLIIKDAELRDNPINPHAPADLPANDLFRRLLPVYNMDQDEVHAVIREIRATLDEFPDRCGIGELWGPLDRWIKYYGEHGEELQLPFNFRLMDGMGLSSMTWDAQALREVVDALETTLPDFAWPNYVLGNHDRMRLVTRFGGEAQARVAAMLLLTLRGTPTLYYGDEIGLPDVPIPPEKIQDPQGRNLGPERSRDVCRTPMQWDASPNAGFCPPEVEPWLPVTADYKTRNVAVMSQDPTSILTLYHQLLALRQETPALFGGRYRPVDAGVPSDCYAYAREADGSRYLIALNFAAEPRTLALAEAEAGRILLSTHLDREEPVTLGALQLRAHEGVIIAL